MESRISQAFQTGTFSEQAITLAKRISREIERGISDPGARTIAYESPEAQLRFWEEDSGKTPPEDLMTLVNNIIERSVNLHRRGYLGHQVPPVLPVNILTAALMAFLNNGMGVYEMGMTGNAMEKIVTGKLARRFGFGNDASGFVTSGGTLGNLTAIMAARAWFLKAHPDADYQQLSIMVSEQAHYSIERTFIVMGIPAENIVKVPADDRFSMNTDILEELHSRASREGKEIFAVVGCACSTATGSYDDLETLAGFAGKHSLWFHVDGAHGGAAIFSETHAGKLKGTEKAHSVILDFHKMMMAPSLSTAVIFRSHQLSLLTFSQKADYLWESREEDEWYHSGKRTFECTKPMSIMHVYTAMRLYGDEIYGEIVDRLYGLATEFADRLRQHPDFELATPPQSNIVCFRYRTEHPDINADALNRHILDVITAEGIFYLVSTRLNGSFYLRTSLMNPFTTMEDLNTLLSGITTAARKYPGS
ncbi:pyridoxal phosphate-dependent decarboxylase family protein [Sinomicrobium soli]|uniref:pyridoxal phosphate-dependent decarboxylase family protein n=1 Tax=Sinomicrobium sp. N-1-3-6 TaxID=2219864 RepID=UPI001374AFF9|nr:pyridoxal-dependent decarboxylase [Sinomicrobium sp. N-1-3-6]